MKDKTKRISSVIIDLIGYGMGITLSINMVRILYGVLIDGYSIVYHSGGIIPMKPKHSLIAEIILSGGSSIFFAYKFIRNMIDREKIKRLKK